MAVGLRAARTIVGGTLGSDLSTFVGQSARGRRWRFSELRLQMTTMSNPHRLRRLQRSRYLFVCGLSRFTVEYGGQLSQQRGSVAAISASMLASEHRRTKQRQAL